MKSSITNVAEVLSNAKSLVSTGFSVGYNFDATNAAEYFDELLDNANSSGSIFSGILILEKIDNDFTIIDGLQRLTTISLLLCALCDSYKNTSKKNQAAKDKIFSMFLVNEGEPKLKLKLEEQKIYRKILFSLDLSEKEKKSNLFQTYQSFMDKLQIHRISGTELFRIIYKIQFMVVVIDSSEVSVRDLYQTINSNKAKSQVNLISDFIRQKSEHAWSEWLKTVNHYKESGCENFLNPFIMDFLIIQSEGKMPKENALYNNFKSYFSKISQYIEIEKIIENMCKYAQYYLKIVNADFENTNVREQIELLNKNNGKEAYSYLMEVIDDLENEHITADVFLEILKMVSSLIIQKREGANLNINFAKLSKEINKRLIFDYTPHVNDENKLTINEISNSSQEEDNM
ncbi:MAG: DUF262 domain-containing protein [Candidatus Gastranaerophilales bacterium]|nr:DUF262 domain-containing protein [Candidatus Gastranaerophilales bacterium]